MAGFWEIMIRVSVVVTVKNEAKSVLALIDALDKQTHPPEEVVFVDGGSTDGTLAILEQAALQRRSWRVYAIPSNRSVGRNEGVRRTTTEWIAFTDAGCVPEIDWLEQLVLEAKTSQAPVIAGFYKGLPSNSLEMAIVPYVLVMPDQFNFKTFLPSSRSMLMSKSLFLEIGGFPEKAVVSEDYIFAKRLNSLEIKIGRAKNAVVGWTPRATIPDFFQMAQSMAKGDAEGAEIRFKVKLIFVRYIIIILLLLIAMIAGSWRVYLLILVLGCAYGLWAVLKNFRYAKNGWYWLGLLQLASDAAVLFGTLEGVYLRKIKN